MQGGGSLTRTSGVGSASKDSGMKEREGSRKEKDYKVRYNCNSSTNKRVIDSRGDGRGPTLHWRTTWGPGSVCHPCVVLTLDLLAKIPEGPKGSL